MTESMTAPYASRFSGSDYTAHYDRYRPGLPPIVAEVLTQYVGMTRPRRVVDLGSGTGLTSRVWAGRADEVIGVDPNADMRAYATARAAELGYSEIRYVAGQGEAIPLEENSVDIVTVSSALHWMDMTATLAEVARVLRPGGVFATIDWRNPPVIHPDMELAFHGIMEQVEAVEIRYGLEPIKLYNKRDEYLAAIKESGHFRYVREFYLHHVDEGSPERLIGLCKSFSGVAQVIQRGATDEELGFTKLYQTAREILGDAPRPWVWSNQVRVGVL